MTSLDTTWCTLGCRPFHEETRCWTKHATHCGHCGQMLYEGEMAFHHTVMMLIHNRAPVWCLRCCSEDIRGEWTPFFVNWLTTPKGIS